jgi:geranylgeranyl reductase family protein
MVLSPPANSQAVTASHSRRRDFDVIVVGAGPAGSSAATFLARQGVSTLVLDRSEFPRDKVCGDGLTPQAIYWLDQLGCVDRVLAQTKACVKQCDLYMDGRLLLTGGFARGTKYPDFAILLDRRRFDHILLDNAMAAGARFQGGHSVRELSVGRDGARVVADVRGRQVEYRAAIVIGADGVSSAVSRQLGNTLKDGVMAASLRAYYDGVAQEGSQIKVYFDHEYFPGYGWLFVDDDGFANVGLGYAYDKHFPLRLNLRRTFLAFIERDLGPMLRHANQCGRISGGAAAFYRPSTIVGDRTMLVGDAANQADPLNGGGIHKAMEGASLAAQAALHALSVGDFTAATLGLYDQLWQENIETDWKTAEFFLSVAKNPALRDLCLYLLTQIGRMTNEDKRFQEFASGVFSGTVAQSICLSPLALYRAFPKQPEAWLALVAHGDHGVAGGSAALVGGAATSLARAAARMAKDPLRNLEWGLEVAANAVGLAQRGVAGPARAPAEDRDAPTAPWTASAHGKAA